MKAKLHLQPLSLWQTVAFFGAPWLLFMAAIYLLLPALDRDGVPLFLNFLLCLGGPLALLLIATGVAYQWERRSWTWTAFRSRFRLEAMSITVWLWTLALSVFMILSSSLLSFTAAWLQQIAPLPAPLVRMFDLQPAAFMGAPLAGAWWLWVGYLVYVLLNVFGEELWWRGYILPRQEAALGQWAWVVHGFCWTLFHTFFYWELLLLLPGCLALAFVASKCKNTWPGIIAHFAYNVPSLVFIVIGVLR
ncbi:MAG: CPBP family intramembrane glutamic endopeptidase [Caldilineaceae bacterium]